MNMQGNKKVTPIKTALSKVRELKMPAAKQVAPAPSTSRSKKYGQPFKSFIGPNWFPKDEPEDMDDVARESREALTRENLLALIDEAEKDVRANPVLLEKIWINTQPKKKADLMSSTDGKLRKLNPVTPRIGQASRADIDKDKSVDNDEGDASHFSVVDLNQPLERGTEAKPRDSQWNLQAMQHLMEDEEPVGELRREHFQQLADMLKEKISEAEIDELLREADFDGNGSIEVDEFKRVLEYFL